MTGTAAVSLRDEAVAAASGGDVERAAALFDQAVAAAPYDAGILNSAGSYHSKQGNREHAISLFQRAVAADPHATDALLNLAILLTAAGRARDVINLLKPRERELSGSARYWSVRANAERAVGAKREALESYTRAVRLPGATPRAMEGRARLALETGLDAREPYRAAMAVARNSPTAVLGYSQALEAAGQADEARAVAEQLVAQTPGWTDGLEWLAQLRWGSGDRESFTDHYEQAVQRAGTSEVYGSWSRMLAGVDRFAEATEVAERARRMLGEGSGFALIEAIHAGEAGDDQRAERIFASLDVQNVDRWVHEARHRLRIGEPERADALTARAIGEMPHHVGAWALRDLAWRLLGDGRHHWLHGNEAIVQSVELDLDEQQFTQAVAFLDRLHDKSTMPVGQSVRDGSQTRGGLFDRHEPEARVLEASFGRAVQRYRDCLPRVDQSHPLLRYRDADWRFAGSWSIRVFKGGRHTEHIHPKGLVSSAAYFVVPAPDPQGDPQAGWLELGRPPPDLRIDLPPLFAIEPRPGYCALFPSTLYHGTRRFSEGKRMTAAVDVHLGDA